MELSAQLARDWALPTTLLDAIVTTEGTAPSPLAARLSEAAEVARALEFDDGFELNELDDPVPLPPEHSRMPTIEALGGIDGIRERVNWFRHATAPRPPRQ